MPQSLNVIALISGGKDSCFSILHCLHHGHKVVALANLHPSDNVEDMDSMTYQTVGHSVIPLYGTCTNIPIFQKPIRGTTICDQQDYSPPDDTEATRSDETEDLLDLLSHVRQTIPEANAVSTGAILSTYQRTRVESVVIRLGMIPLAYLWQYPFLPPPPERDDSSTGLLDDMIAAGCDARLVKIASFGIPSKLIGESLRSPSNVTSLAKGLRRILSDEVELRAAVLGEGGEYETLTVDGPKPLWNQKIASSTQRTAQAGDVHYATLEHARVVSKDAKDDLPEASLRIPVTFDWQFSDALTVLQTSDSLLDLTGVVEPELGLIARDTLSRSDPAELSPSIRESRDHTSISNISALIDCSILVGGPVLPRAKHMHMLASARSSSAGAQMKLICRFVEGTLSRLNVLHAPRHFTTQNVTSTTLLLSSMDDFAEVNTHYGKLFSHINPPARVTIATELEPDTKVSLSLNIDLRSISTQRPLHVQSRSYWAPANIGPYSQAVAERLCSPRLWSPVASNDGQSSDGPELVSFAGQIPLIPISMELANDTPLNKTLLSLQHLWRVAQERKVDFWAWGLAYMARDVATLKHAGIALEAWCELHAFPTSPPQSDVEDEAEEDIWDRTYNKTRIEEVGWEAGNGKHIHTLPNWDTIKTGKLVIPPFIAAEVLGLPRNAPIEWWGSGLGRLPRDSEARLTMSTTSDIADITYSTLTCDSTEHENRAIFTSIFIRPVDVSSCPETFFDILKNALHGGKSELRSIVSGHCLFTGPLGRELYKALCSKNWMSGIAAIPCRAIWAAGATEGGNPTTLNEVVMAILVRSESEL